MAVTRDVRFEEAGAAPSLVSWYGYNDAYDFHPMAFGGIFDPSDVTVAATPLLPGNVPVYAGGTRLLVCPLAGLRQSGPEFWSVMACVRVVIRDTCPGCLARGFALDLSAAAFRRLVNGWGLSRDALYDVGVATVLILPEPGGE